MVRQPWWSNPLHARRAAARPWRAADDWAALAAAFADPALHELACGMGQPPAADYLREVVEAEPSVHLWRVESPHRPGAAGEAGLGPLAVHSLYTTVHRLGVWGLTEADAPLWAELHTLLCAAVFRADAAADHCIVHLPSPPPDWQDAALLAAGYEPYELDPHYKPPLVRQIYGITRATWTLYADEGEEP